MIFTYSNNFIKMIERSKNSILIFLKFPKVQKCINTDTLSNYQYNIHLIFIDSHNDSSNWNKF